MRRPYQILLPLLSLFLVRVDLTDLIPMTYEVRFIRLVDGDTAEVGLGNRRLRVRLAKLDAPEKGQPFLRGQGDAGKFALGCAERVVKGKKNFILTIFKQDIYRRLLGDLDVLSLDLLRMGCASLYPYAEFSSRSEKWTYLRTWSLARREGRGLWGQGGFQRPQLWRRRRKH